MKVLVIGNKGYIGAVLTQTLMDKGYQVTGFDIGYYNSCELYEFIPPIRQITEDVREAVLENFLGQDAVIHLAALSNDPLGELNPRLTEEINLQGTLKVAKLAKAAGVKRFIYVSSQSMYGVANTDAELEEDSSEKNPITAYARTKWEAELALKKMSTPDFAVVCFRPSTVFGASPMLRCDIVFNNLVACAYTTGKIEIKSDGTPWRPVVHVKDVSNAFIAGLEAPLKLVAGESFNVGIANGNYTVRELAEAAQRSVPGSTLVFTGEHGKDSRTYRVSFKKILTVLRDYYHPRWNLDKGGQELVGLFKKVNFNEEMFRGKRTNRLKQINYLLEDRQVDESLRKEKVED